jgi:hypothetical protein
MINEKIVAIAVLMMLLGMSCKNPKHKLIADKDQVVKIEVFSCNDTVINPQSPGCEDIKYGFEGGCVVKVNNTYHMITSEMAGDPVWVKMRTGHWKSEDGLAWIRVGSIRESDADFTGKSQRAAIWGPMVVFDDEDNRWHLVYVCYKSLPDTTNIFRLNYDGVIQHAVSQVEGRDGIDGPYIDKNILMRYDDNPDPWEGLQGTDSFFPYKVGNKWYAFYGSATTQHMPTCKWHIGLAEADKIDGPWKRMSDKNPVNLKSNFAENPIVVRLDNGLFVTIVDGGHFVNKMGYTLSWDGINWSNLRYIEMEPKIKKWWSTMRTPQSLIKENDGTYTMFFTAYRNLGNGKRFGLVSKLKLKLIFDD